MLKEKLLSKIVISQSGCWIWTRGKNKDGYGYLFYEGKMQRATRLSFTLFNESIPQGKLVLHKCDNPSCINPDHLFLGSHADNAKDRNSKGRQARGESHPNAKVTQPTVFKYMSIRNLVILAGFSKVMGTRAARHYTGIKQSTASHINAGRRWHHINLAIPPEVD